MNKWLKRIGALALLALNWAALDDITTGNEPNYWGEWLVVILSGVGALMWGVCVMLQRRMRK